MSKIPYDAVIPGSIALLANVTWEPFMKTPVLFRKRQIVSTFAPVSTEELLRLCPLNNITSADVVAGCVAGKSTLDLSQPK